MNTTEIQTRLDRMPAAMSDKGKIKPGVTFFMRANEGAFVSFNWTRSPSEERDLYSSSDYKSHAVKGETIAEIMDNADAWIASLPSIEEARMNDFTNMLAQTIELGRANGIDVEFVNPLIEAMKRLSENAIEDHSA